MLVVDYQKFVLDDNCTIPTAGCILCELLTGYPLLPGEDEGQYTLTRQCQQAVLLCCR